MKNFNDIIWHLKSSKKKNIQLLKLIKYVKFAQKKKSQQIVFGTLTLLLSFFENHLLI